MSPALRRVIQNWLNEGIPFFVDSMNADRLDALGYPCVYENAKQAATFLPKHFEPHPVDNVDNEWLPRDVRISCCTVVWTWDGVKLHRR